MIDIRRLRADPAAVKAALARRGIELADVDEVLALDNDVRKATGERDELRARVRQLSREVAAARRAGDTQRAGTLAAESRALGDEEVELSRRHSEGEARVRDLLLRLPNLPAEDCPDGAGPEDNRVLRVVGYDADAYGPHQRVPHWDAGKALGILDLEAGAKLSGSMFPLFRGLGARLLRALTSWALDHHAGFEEIRPPTLVRTETMVSTGHLPKFADEAYHVERDDLWGIPTAEVPLTSLGRGEIYDEAQLPIRLTAFTPCYRREAGAAGRDTRGLLRVHEFDKVEILAYTTPEQATAMHTELLDRAESLLAELGLAYRVVDLCTGDLGASAARTFDLEAFAPGCEQWLEVSSVSWFSDYQARRANIRYRPEGGRSPAFVHTLNGSALAWPRVWAALVETFRQPNGSVTIPLGLRPYVGAEAIPAP